jgi:hypothetical protein
MPENAGRFAAVLYDQFEHEDRVADWGGDDLFTRMPSRPPVDDAPAPRFRRSLTLVEPAEERRREEPTDHAPVRDRVSADDGVARGRTLAGDQRTGDQRTGRGGSRASARPARRPVPAESMRDRAERLGLAVVDPAPPEPAVVPEPPPAPLDLPPLEPPAVAGAAAPADAEPPVLRQWDGSLEADPGGRPTRVITGRPDGVPRPLRVSPEHRRRRPSRTPADWIGARPERIVAWAFVLGLVLILIAISTADAATL